MIKKILSRSTTIIVIGILIYFVGRYFYMQPKHINGELAPTFTTELRTGEAFNLSDLKGKFVLLDFWGSWCGPCLQEVPDLVAMHEKFGGKNFEIVSVGVEKKRERWEKAIDRKNLKWKYHVLDIATNLRFFDSKVANLYGIKQVPTKYLINPKGEIMGVNLPFEEMDKLLTKRLK